MNSGRFPLDWNERKPVYGDSVSNLPFDRHYVYHIAWAARTLKRLNPYEHVDISSFAYFNVVLSAFIPTAFYDYRPPPIQLEGLRTGFADLTSLPFENSSIGSLSCMHTVEHIGLGRYGDALDPDGDLKAIGELIRVLKNGGHLLFVVPIGKRKIQFNAHRI